MRTLYLDLDGVMADFDAAFPAVFGLNHRDMADADMWAKINAHPSFFRDLPPCPGAIEFYTELSKMLREYNIPIFILTACCKEPHYGEVARQKMAWVREHLGSDVVVLPVLGGKNKPLFMQAPGDLLIDDHQRNVDVWRAAGGRAILHRTFPETWHQLREGEQS